MRIGRVIGKVTLSQKLDALKPGSLLICEVLDEGGLTKPDQYVPRKSPMPESLVIYDHLGAGENQLIAISESREAAMPFYPEKVAIDGYNAAILDAVDFE